MNIKVVPLGYPHGYIVVADDKYFRSYHYKHDAVRFAQMLPDDHSLIHDMMDPVGRAQCKQCGTLFRWIPSFLNSTKGSFPDYESFPKCPTCGSFRETMIVKELAA